MQFRFGYLVFWLMVAVLFALVSASTGQPLEGGAEVAPVVDWAERIEALITVWLPRAVMLAGVLAAIFPSGNKVMAVLDVLAINWGKARNDPDAQRWGK